MRKIFLSPNMDAHDRLFSSLDDCIRINLSELITKKLIEDIGMHSTLSFSGSYINRAQLIIDFINKNHYCPVLTKTKSMSYLYLYPNFVSLVS